MAFTMVMECLKIYIINTPYNSYRSSKISSKRISVGFRQILALEVAYISYNTGTCALPDIYTCLGPCMPLGIMHIYIYIYIYQATHSCLCYKLYILYHGTWVDQRVMLWYITTIPHSGCKLFHGW